MANTGGERAAAGSRSAALRLLVLGQRIEIRCSDAALLPLLLAQYEALRAPRKSADAPDLLYDIARDSSTYSLLRHGRPAIASHHVAGLLFDLEKDITIAVQRRRPDLLFVHSAALEHHGAAYLLAGASGSGKSTTAWGLLHHGFGYLSDELAPLDVDTLQVHGYPRALCLKQNPPSAYPLPPGHLNCGPTLHVPTEALRGGVARVPCPLAALLFVEHRVGRKPRLLPIGAAEASARLYTTTLNALAHPGRGLDAVLRITSSVPGYVLEAGDLRATCRLVVDLVNGAAP